MSEQRWGQYEGCEGQPETWRILLGIDVHLIGEPRGSFRCTGIGRFSPDFALQPHEKVRCYDARGVGLDARPRRRRQHVDTALRPFGMQNACKGPADGGRVQMRGPPVPTFRIIYREAQ
jgi:hypothetical protein